MPGQLRAPLQWPRYVRKSHRVCASAPACRPSGTCTLHPPHIGGHLRRSWSSSCPCSAQWCHGRSPGTRGCQNPPPPHIRPAAATRTPPEGQGRRVGSLAFAAAVQLQYLLHAAVVPALGHRDRRVLPRGRTTTCGRHRRSGQHSARAQHGRVEQRAAVQVGIGRAVAHAEREGCSAGDSGEQKKLAEHGGLDGGDATKARGDAREKKAQLLLNYSVTIARLG
eukprot:scaffold1307_cov200-Pinguiococcus_pyrenoidosus.AAC.155